LWEVEVQIVGPQLQEPVQQTLIYYQNAQNGGSSRWILSWTEVNGVTWRCEANIRI